jgi:deoxyribonuclease V
MDIPELEAWPSNVPEALALQLKLASQVVRRSRLDEVRLIAGVDVSAPTRGLVRGAVVIMRYPELDAVEQAIAEGAPRFPYIPGLLSFRESPVLLAAFARIQRVPDLILVDGQGLAHPRRCGIASHLGLILGVPTIGCAKSRLIGDHGSLGDNAGDYTELLDGGEVIGVALRTRPRSNPLYISIGHLVDLEAALHWTLACCRGYRLPEPTRLAHIAASGRPVAPEAPPSDKQLALL